MKFILTIHPVVQLTAILLGYYAAYLGIQRLQGLHFGRQVKFQRDRHVWIGAISLLTMLGGFAGGWIIASYFLHDHEAQAAHEVMVLHATIALILLPCMVFGIVTGLYLFLKPLKRTVLPAVHAINNFILLVLALAQIYTGGHIYLTHVVR
jgi:hypothetical protein